MEVTPQVFEGKGAQQHITRTITPWAASLAAAVSLIVQGCHSDEVIVTHGYLNAGPPVAVRMSAPVSPQVAKLPPLPISADPQPIGVANPIVQQGFGFGSQDSPLYYTSPQGPTNSPAPNAGQFNQLPSPNSGPNTYSGTAVPDATVTNPAPAPTRQVAPPPPADPNQMPLLPGDIAAQVVPRLNSRERTSGYEVYPEWPVSFQSPIIVTPSSSATYEVK